MLLAIVGLCGPALAFIGSFLFVVVAVVVVVVVDRVVVGQKENKKNIPGAQDVTHLEPLPLLLLPFQWLERPMQLSIELR